jgi:hypothetical protein
MNGEGRGFQNLLIFREIENGEMYRTFFEDKSKLYKDIVYFRWLMQVSP